MCVYIRVIGKTAVYIVYIRVSNIKIKGLRVDTPSPPSVYKCLHFFSDLK